MTAAEGLPPPNSSAKWGASTLLIANLATRFEFAKAHERLDQEMERLINAIFCLCLFISFDLQNW